MAFGSARTCLSCLSETPRGKALGQIESQDDENASRKPGDERKKPRNTKWVLVVSLNPGGVAGGSGVQHFIGAFDGKKFTAEDIIDPGSPPPGKVFQNFESGTTFADLSWTATGDFVGKGPAGPPPDTTLPGQGEVTGFLGSKLVNTFFNGDSSVGTITSPVFTVKKKYINVLVGGGNHPHDPNASDDPGRYPAVRWRRPRAYGSRHYNL